MIEFYRIKSGPAVVHMAVDDRETEVKSTREAERIAFRIATAQIRAKGGGTGRSNVEKVAPLLGAVPDDALTHENFPGVWLWFAS
jgi:hypothetical protein